MVYRFIDDNKDTFGTRWLLKKFHIYPNAYYNYRKNKKDTYKKTKQHICEIIKQIYYTNHRVIGHRTMKIFLARKGIFLSKTTIHKYMNVELHLHAVVMRKKATKRKEEGNQNFPNLLNQNFTVSGKNKVWCTDFTYISLANGTMKYNCSILDLYDRSIVATMTSNCMNTELAIATLLQALKNEKPKTEIILHSDQGCQFTSQTFVNFCKSNRVLQSMSKVGCPYDNAPMERFYNTLKQELIYRTSFVSEDALKEAINHYVFIWYNHIRPHSYNNGMTPWEARYSV